MPKAPEKLNTFEALVDVVKSLRGPDGCPWDKEQTHKTLTRYAIEECFELVEAIEKESDNEIKDELGDVLFQVILHSEIARQESKFNIFDVIENLNQKMVRRHPHVFNDTKVSGIDEVWDNWEKIKKQENKAKPCDRFDIPSGLPALMRSRKIGREAEKVNFDWQTPEQVFDIVIGELEELKESLGQTKKEQTHEIGDVLFSVAQLSRHLNIDPEQALREGNDRFEKRFFKMKEFAEHDLQDLKPEQLEDLWKRAKKALS